MTALGAAYELMAAHEHDTITDEAALNGLATLLDTLVDRITPAADVAVACRGYAVRLRSAQQLVTSWRQLAEWIDRVFGMVRYSIYGLHPASIENEIFGLGDELERVLRPMTVSRAPTNDIAAARILVVDDSHIVRQIVAAQLRKGGHEVETADTFAACQEILKTFSPTLVLCDVVLPDVAGDELCAAIKAQSARLIPVVLMSNLPDHELAARANAVGADGYVSKRHGVEKLVAMLTGILSDLIY